MPGVVGAWHVNTNCFSTPGAVVVFTDARLIPQLVVDSTGAKPYPAATVQVEVPTFRMRMLTLKADPTLTEVGDVWLT